MNGTVREAIRAGADGSWLLGEGTAWARDPESAEAPAIAIAWTRGLLLPTWTTAAHGPAWLVAARSDDALCALMAPLLALGLLALPRDARGDALRLAPSGFDAATRAAFLRIRELERPAPGVVELAGDVWSTLRRLSDAPVSARTRVVSAVMSVLGTVLAWELDVLADGPPVLATLQVHGDARALAAWGLAQIAEASA